MLASLHDLTKENTIHKGRSFCKTTKLWQKRYGKKEKNKAMAKSDFNGKISSVAGMHL